MKRLLLERFGYSPECTEGELFLIDDDNPGLKRQHICWTLELKWFGNKPGQSCIPEGDYWLSPWTRPDGRFAYIVYGLSVGKEPHEIKDKVTRWGILFHVANKPSELKGCIAPGTRRKPGIMVRSREAMRAMRTALKETFQTHDRMVLSVKHKQSEAVL